MIKHIKARTFANYLTHELMKLHPCSIVKSIGTNQTQFIIRVETPDGKEHKIYIPCEEDDSMIRFVGTDTSGEVAIVTAEKSNEGRYEVAGSFDIPIFGMNNDDD